MKKGMIARRLLIAAFALALMIVPALAETLTLPDDLTVIEEEAFLGTASIDEVVIPEGVTEIGPRAFSDSSLTSINLPSSVASIADDAFDGSALTQVEAEKGTYGYSWAVAHGYIEPEDTVELTEIELSVIDVHYADKPVDLTIQTLTEDGLLCEQVKGTAGRYFTNDFVTCTNAWTAASDSDWLRVENADDEALSEVSYDVDTHALCLVFDANDTGAIREGHLTIDCFAAVKTITFRQLPDITPTLLSPDLSPDDWSFDYPTYTLEGSALTWRIPAGAVSAELNDVDPYHDTEDDRAYTIEQVDLGDCEGSGGTLETALPATFLTTIGAVEPNRVRLITYDEAGYRYATPLYSLFITDSEYPEWSYCYQTDEDTGAATGVAICGYSGSAAMPAIPDSIHAVPVTRINDYAFGGNTRITSIAVPQSVTAIGANAFYSCGNLAVAVLPETVTISDSAFGDCASLKYVFVGDAATDIDTDAFTGSGSVRLFSLKGSDVETFAADNGIAFIALDESNATIVGSTDVEGRISVIQGFEGDVAVVPSVYRRQTYTIVSSFAVGVTNKYNENVKVMVLPDSIVQLEEKAFNNCKNLEVLFLPGGVTEIGSSVIPTNTLVICPAGSAAETAAKANRLTVLTY